MTATAVESILFLGKADDRHTAEAGEHCARHCARTTICLGRHADPFPEAAASWQGDLIVSYLSRWIVPAAVLEMAARAAINFHPAPPEYRGIGCTNFALYEGAPDYGATCHHMTPVVDGGAIIDVQRLPILETDDVASLLARTYDHQFALFREVMDRLFRGEPLPRSAERCGAHLYTRTELDALATLTTEMSADEVRRRVRATTFGAWRPTLDLHGLRFVYQPDAPASTGAPVS
jgi:methionyl-tRNA formyltransferase